MGTCERLMRVEKSADVVWDWMSDPQNLFSINMFHAEVGTDESELRTGATYPIDHDFFGLYKQARQAKIRQVERYFVAWGEYKVPEAPGRDPFPHNQSLRVVPVDDSSCILVNRVTGRYIFPGSNLLGEPAFRRYLPVILDDDNQVVAVGCGALEPGKLKLPTGLFLYPLMAASTRFLKKSTRRQVIARVKADRAAAATASTSDETTAAS